MGSFLRCRLKLHPRGAHHHFPVRTQSSTLPLGSSWRRERLTVVVGGTWVLHGAPSVLAFVRWHPPFFFDKTGPLQLRISRNNLEKRILPIIHRTLFNKAITCAIHPCMAALFFCCQEMLGPKLRAGSS